MICLNAKNAKKGKESGFQQEHAQSKKADPIYSARVADCSGQYYLEFLTTVIRVNPRPFFLKPSPVSAPSA
jgi:hypothetical protein